MITRSTAVVGAGGVLLVTSSRPPLTIRKVRQDEPDVCGLCLIGSAAGPLAGDDVTLDLELAAGARARLTAAGASLAQGRPSDDGTPPGRLRSIVRLGADADLDAEPAPLIAAAGSRTEVSVEITLAATATLRWRELVVLGRSAEITGAVTLRWSVYRDGAPLLVQSVAITADAWPGVLGGNRVLATALAVGVVGRTLVDSPTAVCQQLSDDSVLVTVLDSDAAGADVRLRSLLAGLDPVLSQPVQRYPSFEPSLRAESV